jgi:hypothetical protein
VLVQAAPVLVVRAALVPQVPGTAEPPRAVAIWATRRLRTTATEAADRKRAGSVFWGYSGCSACGGALRARRRFVMLRRVTRPRGQVARKHDASALNLAMAAQRRALIAFFSPYGSID